MVLKALRLLGCRSGSPWALSVVLKALRLLGSRSGARTLSVVLKELRLLGCRSVRAAELWLPRFACPPPTSGGLCGQEPLLRRGLASQTHWPGVLSTLMRIREPWVVGVTNQPRAESTVPKCTRLPVAVSASVFLPLSACLSVCPHLSPSPPLRAPGTPSACRGPSLPSHRPRGSRPDAGPRLPAHWPREVSSAPRPDSHLASPHCPSLCPGCPGV